MKGVRSFRKICVALQKTEVNADFFGVFSGGSDIFIRQVKQGYIASTPARWMEYLPGQLPMPRLILRSRKRQVRSILGVPLSCAIYRPDDVIMFPYDIMVARVRPPY